MRVFKKKRKKMENERNSLNLCFRVVLDKFFFFLVVNMERLKFVVKRRVEPCAKPTKKELEKKKDNFPLIKMIKQFGALWQ